jgi:hypothetical protein
MYRAINKYVIVEGAFDDSKKQYLESTVIATTTDTERLQGLTIVAPRHKYLELGETEDDAVTSTGIYLGSKNKYAAVNIDEIIAIKHE